MKNIQTDNDFIINDGNESYSEEELKEMIKGYTFEEEDGKNG